MGTFPQNGLMTLKSVYSLTFTFSKLTKEILKKDVKYTQIKNKSTRTTSYISFILTMNFSLSFLK